MMKKRMLSKISASMKNREDSKDPQYQIQFVQEGFCLTESDQPVRAAVGFISSGPDRSAVEEAMSMFRKIKFPAAGFYMNSITPFPVLALEAFAEKVEKIVVIESGATPFISKIMTEETWIKPVVMVPLHGGSITARDIFEKEDWN